MQIVDFLRALVEPRPELVDVEDRRRARILTSLLVTILPLALLTIVFQIFVIPTFLPALIANAVTLGLLAAVVVVARGRYYRYAAVAAMIIIVAACVGIGITNPEMEWWAYMLIAVLLSTVLVSIRAAVWVSVLVLAAPVLVGLYHGSTVTETTPPLMFLVLFVPLQLTMAHYRNRLEEERRREIVIQGRLIEDAQQTAGLGHWEMARGSSKGYASAALAELLGMKSQDFPLATLLNCFSSADRPRARALIEGAAPTPHSEELTFARADGSEGVATVSVVLHDEGQRGRVIGTIHDLTDRIRQEQEKSRLLSKALESRRLETIGRVAGGVAHDFNNLLTIFVTSSSLLREEPDDEMRADVLDEIDLAAQRGTSLVRNLLAYARRQVLEPTDLNVKTVIDELTPILRRLAKCELEINVPSYGTLIEADRSQIEQIVLNLVVNASDACGDDGLIQLELHEETPRTGPLAQTPCAVIEVRDNGPGMSEEVRGRIFEPFFTTKGARGGTGLGLSTVHGIVHQSGGELTLETTVGKGTSFSVFLPILEESAPLPASPRALVVDDEELVLRTTARILLQAGFEVTAVDSAPEALERWEALNGAFDLVVSDLVMPETDGATLLKELLERKEDLNAVLVTGFAGDRLKGQEALLKRVKLVQKPFTPQSLLEAIEEET
jgi:PAS domain S-box-containing protein